LYAHGIAAGRHPREVVSSLAPAIGQPFNWIGRPEPLPASASAQLKAEDLIKQLC
jgi:hypothetical protein